MVDLKGSEERGVEGVVGKGWKGEGLLANSKEEVREFGAGRGVSNPSGKEDVRLGVFTGSGRGVSEERGGEASGLLFGRKEGGSELLVPGVGCG